jgi:hypothetical protein
MQYSLEGLFFVIWNGCGYNVEDYSQTLTQLLILIDYQDKLTSQEILGNR